MALLPRWRCMSDDAKAVTRRVGWSALAILVVAVVLRPLLPWLALSILLYLIWQKRRQRRATPRPAPNKPKSINNPTANRNKPLMLPKA